MFVCCEVIGEMFLFADFKQHSHMDFCGSPVMRITVCFIFQQNPPLAFGRTMLWKWLKSRAYSVPYKLHILAFRALK